MQKVLDADYDVRVDIMEKEIQLITKLKLM